MNTPPSFVAPFLWSYDVSALDIQKNKKRIITNVLNLGTEEATDWLFRTYTNDDICEALLFPLPGEWNTKSLHFWSLVLGVTPGSIERNVP